MIPRLLFALLAALALTRAWKPWPYCVDSEPEPARAVLLHPRSTAIRTAYALELERRGSVGEAERQLLEAARNDRQYAPAWQLSDFYFRQRQINEFLVWAHLAAERSYGDLGALFRLATELSVPGDQMRKTLLVRPAIERNYVAWLLEHRQLQEIEPVAALLAKRSQPADREMLLAYVDALIADGDPATARRAWKLVDASDGLVANRTFAREPLGQGFDWRPIATDGIRQFRSNAVEPNEAGWVIEFSGRQPELCDLITQYVVLEPGHPYQIRVSGSWPNEAGSGLSVLIGRQEVPVSNSKQVFKPTTPLNQLILRYRRTRGQVRLEGRAILHEISLAPLGDR